MNSISRETCMSAVACLLAACTFYPRHVVAKPRPPVPEVPESAPVLFYEGFDELFDLNRTNAVIDIPDFGQLVESWSGFALQRHGTVAPLVVPALDALGHTNFSCGAGALRFWITPYWSSATPESPLAGPGTFARLAEMTLLNEPEPLWSLQVDSQGTTISVIAAGDSGPVTLLSAPIQWQAGTVSHLVWLNYSPQGTALFIDGHLSATGPGTPSAPPPISQIVVGSTLAGTDAAGGALDEVCFLGWPLLARDIALHYSAYIGVSHQGPISPEQEAAWRLGLSAFALSQGPLLSAQTQSSADPPPLPGIDPGTGEEPVVCKPAYDYPSNSFFVIILPISSNATKVDLILTSTVPDVRYDIWSREALTNTTWQPEVTVFWRAGTGLDPSECAHRLPDHSALLLGHVVGGLRRQRAGGLVGAEVLWHQRD